MNSNLDIFHYHKSCFDVFNRCGMSLTRKSSVEGNTSFILIFRWFFRPSGPEQGNHFCLFWMYEPRRNASPWLTHSSRWVERSPKLFPRLSLVLELRDLALCQTTVRICFLAWGQSVNPSLLQCIIMLWVCSCGYFKCFLLNLRRRCRRQCEEQYERRCCTCCVGITGLPGCWHRGDGHWNSYDPSNLFTQLIISEQETWSPSCFSRYCCREHFVPYLSRLEQGRGKWCVWVNFPDVWDLTYSSSRVPPTMALELSW